MNNSIYMYIYRRIVIKDIFLTIYEVYMYRYLSNQGAWNLSMVQSLAMNEWCIELKIDIS